ncbi:replication factor-A carboxy-terminal domain protein [Wolffia australiana]
MAVVERATPWMGICTILAVDSSSISYQACAVCERPVADGGAAACRCSRPFRRFYRLLISVATADEVLAVVCFDRVARGLVGGPADEFVDLCSVNEESVQGVLSGLEGEPFWMTLTRPRSGAAQHLRVTAMVPLSSAFCPLMELLQ